MKASELIIELAKAIDSGGDQEVEPRILNRAGEEFSLSIEDVSYMGYYRQVIHLSMAAEEPLSGFGEDD